MGKKKKGRVNIVYSTDPGYQYEYKNNKEEEIIPASEQVLYVSLDRKGRKGKVVTLVEGFRGPDKELKSLEKLLKAKCGTGGSSKGGEILIQGDLREKIFELLKTEGFGTKKKGG